MVAPAALLTTAENFTESCLLRGTLTDLIGRMTVCCYLTLFGLSGAPPMLELLLRQVRISECSGDALEVEMTVAELPVELRAFLVHSRRGRQRLAQLLDLLERLGLLWRQRAPLRSHASLPSADGAAAGAHRKRSGSQRQSAAAENDEAAANFDGVLLHKYAAAVLPTADRQPPTAEFSVHAAAIAAAAGVADTSSATIGHVGPGEWFALSGSEGRAAYWEALRRACSGSRGRKRDSTERSIMGVLHVTQRGEATAAAEIEGAAHPSSHSNGAADTRGSKLLLQDLDWTGVRPLYAEQRMRLERELPRDQPTGAASLCDLAERVEVHPQQLRAWYAALARRASSNSAAPCAPAWIGIPGAGDESEGTAGEACAATGEACAGNSASLAAAGAHACDGLSLRVEPSGREGSQMNVPWDAAAQCTLLSCFAEEVVRLLTERDPVLRMKIQHAHEDPLRVSTDVVGQYVRWEDVALRVGRPAASCRALLRRVLLGPPTQGLQLRRQLALVALQHLRARGIRDQRPAPARSAARHAQQILNALGVGLEQHGSTRASELGAAAALPSRMLALHERVKLLLGASENDYRPSLGLQLLRPFTREETDAAFQQLTRLGWIARQKEKHTQCQRRFKLSARYHEQLTPPMPDAAARAVMEGTAALFEGEEAEVPQAADARSALVAFERVARGDVDLSATSAVDTAAAAAEGGALVAKPPEEDHGAGPVGLPAERKRKRHGQGVRFHLLQGMLEARRAQPPPQVGISSRAALAHSRPAPAAPSLARNFGTPLIILCLKSSCTAGARRLALAGGGAMWARRSRRVRLVVATRWRRQRRRRRCGIDAIRRSGLRQRRPRSASAKRRAVRWHSGLSPAPPWPTRAASRALLSNASSTLAVPPDGMPTRQLARVRGSSRQWSRRSSRDHFLRVSPWDGRALSLHTCTHRAGWPLRPLPLTPRAATTPM